MFDSIRDRIHTVRQDISNRNLAIGENDGRYLQSGRPNCNVNAGGDLLSKYQNQWMEIHHITEENAQKAEEIDSIIQSLHGNCKKQWIMIGELNSQLALLPKLKQTILSLMDKIGTLENCFQEVETALLNLEDTIEIQELQEKQLDKRFQCVLYEEKRFADLEQLKAQLASEHAKKVKEFETNQQVVLKERQEAFREAFEEEMEHYKTHGHLEKIPNAVVESNIQLEEVQLDDDISVLDEFLAEEATEDTLRQYALAEAMADENNADENSEEAENS